MLKRRPDNRMSFKTPLTGYGIMLLAILCFLIMRWALLGIVRGVVGRTGRSDSVRRTPECGRLSHVAAIHSV